MTTPTFCDRHEQYYQKDVATGEWRCPDCPTPEARVLPVPSTVPVSLPAALDGPLAVLEQQQDQNAEG